jgi:PAS domain S-box-containing protein
MGDASFGRAVLGGGYVVAGGVWMLLLVLSVGRPAFGQDTLDTAAPSPDSLATVERVSIAQVRTDADANRVPDRLGDTLRVRGRASVRQGALPDENLIFLQDGTAGIAVRLPEEGATVGRGDSLHVAGVVRHQYGLTRLHALRYSRVGAMSRFPSPVPLTVSAAHTDRYEGQLAQVRGEVVANRSNDGGRYLLLKDVGPGTSVRLAVFVPNRRLEAVPLDDFEAGDEITVTGVLSQYDYSPPYDEYYQILPRDGDDLSGAGLAAYYQTIILLFVAGGLLAVIVVFTLRAAVRRRTQQLTESRARFRRLAEATFEGIIIHEDGEILDVNRALTDMIGYDRDMLVGRDFWDVLTESTRDLMREMVESRPDEPYEAVMVREDGTSFPAEIEEKEVEVTDRPVRVAAIRDVTERKKREAEILLAKEEAEQMARLKSSLLNNMSHELRTPITSIIGYAELIMNEPEGPHEDFAARIRQSGKRLSRTLRAVLEMAQIESGTLEVQPREVGILSLMRDVVREYRPMAAEEDLALEVRERIDDATLYTDRTLVYRAVGNIVHNAIKFSEEGPIRIDTDATDAGVRIAVSDSGIGIDPDFRPHLFEPFKQESEGRARTHEGTGLGLALTKRMVDLLGGTIEVESVKGEGSTFVVELPPVMPTEEHEAAVMERDAS